MTETYQEEHEDWYSEENQERIEEYLEETEDVNPPA